MLHLKQYYRWPTLINLVYCVQWRIHAMPLSVGTDLSTHFRNKSLIAIEVATGCITLSKERGWSWYRKIYSVISAFFRFRKTSSLFVLSISLKDAEKPPVTVLLLNWDIIRTFSGWGQTRVHSDNIGWSDDDLWKNNKNIMMLMNTCVF